MDKQTLQEGFDQLDALAREEYHQPLQDVTNDRDRERIAIRIGRLVGVMLKEPFAEPEPLSEPSERTNAYRSGISLVPKTSTNSRKTQCGSTAPLRK